MCSPKCPASRNGSSLSGPGSGSSPKDLSSGSNPNERNGSGLRI